MRPWSHLRTTTWPPLWCLRLRIGYFAAGNVIIERCHRSGKRFAARKCSARAMDVYWYSDAPKEDIDPATAPANKLDNHDIRIRGIDRVLRREPGAIDCPCEAGDAVLKKPSENRCHTKFKLGTGWCPIKPPKRWMVCHNMYANYGRLYHRRLVPCIRGSTIRSGDEELPETAIQ